jgi:hypothetical protein
LIDIQEVNNQSGTIPFFLLLVDCCLHHQGGMIQKFSLEDLEVASAAENIKRE